MAKNNSVTYSTARCVVVVILRFKIYTRLSVMLYLLRLDVNKIEISFIKKKRSKRNGGIDGGHGSHLVGNKHSDIAELCPFQDLQVTALFNQNIVQQKEI